MTLNLILTGDINLMGVENPAVPFSLVEREFRAADIVFGNLESCLYDAPGPHRHDNPAFFAPSKTAGDALKCGGIQAVGLANNVNFGDEAIAASIRRLDELHIPHTGAGKDLAAAREPVILERKGRRIGFLQRTSIYWAANHEAKMGVAGVAVIRGHTAYELPLNREVQPMNRPGVAPIILTWANPQYLQALRDDIKGVRDGCDIVVASFHWGVGPEVLQYMKEIAHAAIDEGADLVIGHGPHDHVLPVEMYKGKPIFYGLGALSFFIGHGGRKRGWAGMLVRATFDGRNLTQASFQFVRQDEAMRVTLCRLEDERALMAKIAKGSAGLGATLTPKGDQVFVA